MSIQEKIKAKEEQILKKREKIKKEEEGIKKLEKEIENLKTLEIKGSVSYTHLLLSSGKWAKSICNAM